MTSSSLAAPAETPTASTAFVTSEIVKSNNTLINDKYHTMKRKLKESIEINQALSKSYARAKKKVKILTFERNILLDSIAHFTKHYSSFGVNSSISNHELHDSELEQVTRVAIESSYHHQQQQPTAITSNITTTVTSASPKRSKINKVNKKTRRVQPIERDFFGNPKLPQQIGVLTVVDLGRINSTNEQFHNERYIFPIGYTVKRTYPSMIDPESNTIITSTILDGGDGPRFQVIAADQPDDPIIANSATGAWTVVVRRSNEIRHREHSNSASGPDYFGFKHPTIAKMIQDLPSTEKLKNYVWQSFEEMEPRAAKGVMAAAEKKRDTLESMGNTNRKIFENDEQEEIKNGSRYDYYSLQHKGYDLEEVDELVESLSE